MLFLVAIIISIGTIVASIFGVGILATAGLPEAFIFLLIYLALFAILQLVNALKMKKTINHLKEELAFENSSDLIP